VIPGNDDALRAIRLFASKISDSIVEGSQMATDKQSAELAAAVAQSAHDESAHEAEGGEAGLDAGAEEISMEDVLGGGTKKVPAAEKEAADEVPQVESQTF
jgi:small subunit ribosomal protein S2